MERMKYRTEHLRRSMAIYLARLEAMHGPEFMDTTKMDPELSRKIYEADNKRFLSYFMEGGKHGCENYVPGHLRGSMHPKKVECGAQ